MGAAVLSHGCVYSSGMSIQLTGANKKITLFSHTLSQPLIAPLNMLSEACFFLPPVLKAIWSLMVFRLKIKSSNIQIIFVQEFMYLVWAMSKTHLKCHLFLSLSVKQLWWSETGLVIDPFFAPLSWIFPLFPHNCRPKLCFYRDRCQYDLASVFSGCSGYFDLTPSGLWGQTKLISCVGA